MSGSNLFTGTLDLLILQSVRPERRHGYGIGQWIRRTSQDALAVEEGVLYPALKRLERNGWLTSDWDKSETGRRAKFYELTPAGVEHLESELARWAAHTRAVGRVLKAGSTG